MTFTESPGRARPTGKYCMSFYKSSLGLRETEGWEEGGWQEGLWVVDRQHGGTQSQPRGTGQSSMEDATQGSHVMKLAVHDDNCVQRVGFTGGLRPVAVSRGSRGDLSLPVTSPQTVFCSGFILCGGQSPSLLPSSTSMTGKTKFLSI